MPSSADGAAAAPTQCRSASTPRRRNLSPCRALVGRTCLRREIQRTSHVTLVDGVHVHSFRLQESHHVAPCCAAILTLGQKEALVVHAQVAEPIGVQHLRDPDARRIVGLATGQATRRQGHVYTVVKRRHPRRPARVTDTVTAWLCLDTFNTWSQLRPRGLPWRWRRTPAPPIPPAPARSPAEATTLPPPPTHPSRPTPAPRPSQPPLTGGMTATSSPSRSCSLDCTYSALRASAQRGSSGCRSG